MSDLDLEPIQKAIRDWAVGGSGLPRAVVYWGQQDSPRPAAPAIEMRVLTIHTLGMAWLSTETQVLSFAPRLVIAVSAVNSTLTVPDHGFTNGDGPVRVNGDDLPGGLTPDRNYWIIFVAPATIQLARTFADTGGAVRAGNPVTPVTLTSSNGSTFTIVATASTVRGAGPIRYVSRSHERLGVMFTSRTSEAIGMTSAMGYLSRIKAAQKLPSQQTILQRVGLGLTDVERPRAVHGVRNAVMFEPRAIMEVYFSLPTEASEPGQVIERVQITGRRIARS